MSPAAEESFKSFTKSRFILCEGEDDKGFLETIIKERRIPEFQVRHAAECNSEGTGGKDGFVKALQGFEATTGFSDVLKALLIVTDNDEPWSSFQRIQQMLTSIRKCECVPPETVKHVGTIAGKPLAVLMIPSADDEGNLETLCLPEIHDKWPAAKKCVSAFMECTGADKWTKRGSIHKTRARSAVVGFHENDPYKGIGYLFRSGMLSTLNPCFNGVAEFLQNFDKLVGTEKAQVA
jgi:hypothetical protein